LSFFQDPISFTVHCHIVNLWYTTVDLDYTVRHCVWVIVVGLVSKKRHEMCDGLAISAFMCVVADVKLLSAFGVPSWKLR
jgi:hypothetical protein